MTEMIERVARALDPWTMAHQDANKMARAVIAAMREPTMEMCQAGGKCISPGFVWQAMIDAALGKS